MKFSKSCIFPVWRKYMSGYLGSPMGYQCVCLFSFLNETVSGRGNHIRAIPGGWCPLPDHWFRTDLQIACLLSRIVCVLHRSQGPSPKKEGMGEDAKVWAMATGALIHWITSSSRWNPILSQTKITWIIFIHRQYQAGRSFKAFEGRTRIKNDLDELDKWS